MTRKIKERKKSYTKRRGDRKKEKLFRKKQEYEQEERKTKKNYIERKRKKKAMEAIHEKWNEGMHKYTQVVKERKCTEK